MEYNFKKSSVKKQAIYILLLILFIFNIPLFADDGKNSSIVILHINDTHGNLYPVEFGDASAGGFARIAGAVNKIRQGNENILVLHAGDLISRGDPVTSYYMGEVNIKAMALIGFDAMTPGNGDFYSGTENLRKLADISPFPFLHANAVIRKNAGDTLMPWIIKEINGTRVAIIGLGQLNFSHPSIKEVKYIDPFKTAGRLLPKLRKKADIFLVLSHLGYFYDQKLARENPQIDIIVGGHTHTVIQSPLEITNPGNEKKTYIVQAGDYCKYIGRVDIETEKINDNIKIRNLTGQLIPLDSSIPENPEVAAMLAEARLPLQEQIAMLKEDMPHYETGDSPFRSGLLDYLRSSTGSQVAFIDDTSLSGGLPAGPVKKEDIFEIHPFRNKIASAEVKGEMLEKVLSGKNIFASGCEISKTDDSKILIMINGKQINPKEKYSLTGTDFLFKVYFPKAKFRETGKSLDNIIEEYVKSLSAE